MAHGRESDQGSSTRRTEPCGFVKDGRSIACRNGSVVETQLEQKILPLTELGADFGQAGHLNEAKSPMESNRRFVCAELDAIARSLNTRPRQTLGWMTPSQAFAEAVALTH